MVVFLSSSCWDNAFLDALEFIHSILVQEVKEVLCKLKIWHWQLSLCVLFQIQDDTPLKSHQSTPKLCHNSDQSNHVVAKTTTTPSQCPCRDLLQRNKNIKNCRGKEKQKATVSDTMGGRKRGDGNTRLDGNCLYFGYGRQREGGRTPQQHGHHKPECSQKHNQTTTKAQPHRKKNVI